MIKHFNILKLNQPYSYEPFCNSIILLMCSLNKLFEKKCY